MPIGFWSLFFSDFQSTPSKLPPEHFIFFIVLKKRNKEPIYRNSSKSPKSSKSNEIKSFTEQKRYPKISLSIPFFILIGRSSRLCLIDELFEEFSGPFLSLDRTFCFTVVMVLRFLRFYVMTNINPIETSAAKWKNCSAPILEGLLLRPFGKCQCWQCCLNKKAVFLVTCCFFYPRFYFHDSLGIQPRANPGRFATEKQNFPWKVGLYETAINSQVILGHEGVRRMERPYIPNVKSRRLTCLSETRISGFTSSRYSSVKPLQRRLIICTLQQRSFDAWTNQLVIPPSLTGGKKPETPISIHAGSESNVPYDQNDL